MAKHNLTRALRIVVALCFLTGLVACGGGSGDAPLPSPTPQPEPTATAAPTPTAEPEDDDGIVGGALNKAGDIGGAIWGGVSGPGSWIWGGVSGAGGWLWDRVTGLPNEVGDIFVRFYRWLKGTALGEAVLVTTISTIETARDVIEAVTGFSLSGFLWRVVRYVLYALLALLVVGLLLYKVVLPFLGGLPWRMARMTRQAVRDGRQVNAQERQSRTDAAGKKASSQPLAAAVDDQRGVPTVNVYVNSVPVAGPDVSQDVVTAQSASVLSTATSRLAWSQDHIRDLEQRVSNPTITALFDLAWARNGQAVNYRELMDVTHRTSNQVRADFAAFSRICKSVRSDEAWPIDSVPATDGVSRSAYRINDQYLRWWFEG